MEGLARHKSGEERASTDALLEGLVASAGRRRQTNLPLPHHLLMAEVYLALEQRDKAIETWKKGLGCPPVSKRDEARKLEVEKKLKKLEDK